MNKNEYEKLIKEGYTEEQIDANFDNVSKLEVFDSPMSAGRQDKGVFVTDREGLSKRTSSIMMGYNKEGITLDNGEYVSWKEVQQVLGETLSNDDENITYISVSTGKKVGSTEIMEDIFKRSTEKTYLSQEPTDKIANQQASQMVVHDEKKGDFSKGITMLGNDGLQLSDGKYVSKNEIETALSDYIKLKAPEAELPPEKKEPTPPGSVIPPERKKEEPKKEETYTLIQRFFRKYSWVPIAVALAAEVLSGFGKADIIEKQEIAREVNNLDYGVKMVQTIEHEFETSQEVYERLYDNVVTGEQIEVNTPVTYHESSDYKYGGANKQGIVGQELGFGGYEIQGFSIIENGQIREVEFNKGENLYDKLEEVSKEVGSTIEELEPMIHMVQVDGYHAGWVSASDLFSNQEKQPQLKDIKVILDESSNYKGEIEDFKGDTITFNNGKEDVTINIKKEDGSYVEDGDLVFASDGEQYEITDLNITETDVIDYEEVKTGTKVNWSFKNITLEEHLAAAAIAAVGSAVSLRKKKEKVDMTSTEIDVLIEKEKEEFNKLKGEYLGNSEFRKATETLLGKEVDLTKSTHDTLKEELINQNITVEEVQNLSETMGGRSR